MPESFDLDLVAGAIEEGWDVGDAHPLHKGTVLLVARLDHACRRIEPQQARRLGMNEAVFERDGHRADGAMAAHGQAARCLDEQDANIAIRPRRRVEDRARHHVVPARLEHEACADPVVFRQEMLAAVEHRVPFELGDAAPAHHADRVAAGVAVDAEEGVARHGLTRCSQEVLSQMKGGA